MKPTIAEVGAGDHSGKPVYALETDVAFLNARAAALSARRANAALAPLGLKVRSYSVLALAADRQPPSQRQLAAFLQLDPSQIVSIVDDLERAGLVGREPEPSDRRVKVIVATEAGRALCRQAERAAAGAQDHTLRRLDASERAQLLAILHKIALDDVE